MEGRRRYRRDKYHHEVAKVNRKSSAGDWQHTVPSWEKKFCTSNCKVPWNKIVDAKRYLHCHDNVMNWDDSAAKEAFDEAKMRYYAETHGLPCETEMPDPDKYIDEIDWDCQIDQDLLHDLVKRPVDDVDTVRKRENIVIFGDSFLQDQGFSSTGWGDGAEESKEKPKISPNVDVDKPWEHKIGQNNGPVEGNAWTNTGYNSWGWYDNNNAPMGGYGWGDGWGCSGPTGWGDGWNDSTGWYNYGNNNAQEYVEEDPNAIYGGAWYTEYPHKGGDTGNKVPGFAVQEHNGYLPPDYRPYNNSYMPRHETSKFHGSNYQKNQYWRNADSARNKVNFVSEQQAINRWSASREKLTTSCAPVISQVSGKPQNCWSMDKPVS